MGSGLVWYQLRDVGGAEVGLMDRVREQAAQVAEHGVGAAVYAERTGRGGTDTADKIERLVTALSQQEAEQGLGDTDGPAPPTA